MTTARRLPGAGLVDAGVEQRHPRDPFGSASIGFERDAATHRMAGEREPGWSLDQHARSHRAEAVTAGKRHDRHVGDVRQPLGHRLPHLRVAQQAGGKDQVLPLGHPASSGQ